MYNTGCPYATLLSFELLRGVCVPMKLTLGQRALSCPPARISLAPAHHTVIPQKPGSSIIYKNCGGGPKIEGRYLTTRVNLPQALLQRKPGGTLQVQPSSAGAAPLLAVSTRWHAVTICHLVKVL